jgi:hypothetical protein
MEAVELKKKSTSKLKNIPGVKQIGDVAKGIANQVKNVPKRSDGGSNTASPAAGAVVPAGEGELPADYEEQSLGSFIGKVMVMVPGWVKEYVTYYQPTARQLGDLASMIYDIFHGNHELSLYAFLGFLLLAAAAFYLPFHHFLSGFGMLIIFVLSPLMYIVLGVVNYLQRARRSNDPAVLGFADNFSNQWLSKDAAASRNKKLAKGASSFNFA